jgi:hypothetical protein
MLFLYILQSFNPNSFVLLGPPTDEPSNLFQNVGNYYQFALLNISGILIFHVLVSLIVHKLKDPNEPKTVALLCNYVNSHVKQMHSVIIAELSPPNTALYLIMVRVCVCVCVCVCVREEY